MLRFDANLRWLFTELPMPQRYEAAARAGFQGVEVAFPYEYPAKQIAGWLRDNDLTLVQILSPFDWDGGERGLAALPGRSDDFKAGFRTAVDYAAELGRPFIHVMPGNIGRDLDRARCMDQFLENLAWAADAAPELTLILEPCCRARFSEFLYHRLDEGIAVLQQLRRANVKLCYDTFHIQMEEGALADRLRAAWPHIGHIQVGNVPGRHEPGTGEIHFPYLFKLIEELGWQGWIGCEYAPSGHTLDTLSWGKPFGVGVAATREAASC